MKRKRAFECLLLTATILLAGCGRNSGKAPRGRQKTLVLYYTGVWDNYRALRRAAGAEKPSFEDWESRHRPLLKHLPAWLKGTVAVRARIIMTHAPILRSPSVTEQRFFIIFRLNKGGCIPSHAGIRTITLHHGPVGMVSMRFMGDRKIGAMWQIAFTPKGEAVGVIPNGPYHAPNLNNLKQVRLPAH